MLNIALTRSGVFYGKGRVTMLCLHTVAQYTVRTLSKADSNHFIASKDPPCSCCFPLSGACLGKLIEHIQIVARSLVPCLSVTEQHKLLTFYFGLRALMFSFSKEPHCNTQVIYFSLFSHLKSSPSSLRGCLFKGKAELSFHSNHRRPTVSSIQKLNSARTFTER